MRSELFVLPRQKTYLCGHSLGPSTIYTANAVNKSLNTLQTHGVLGWNLDEWIDLPFRLGEKIGQLLGAKPNEVIVTDSTTVNLFKVLKAAIGMQPGRSTILTTEDNFPADLYISAGITEIRTVRSDELQKHFDSNIAVLLLTHVNYRNGSMLDMQSICQDAAKHGILTVWDLSHSVGAVPLNLEATGADFAVGCTYKYLSGGPGSPAFVYARQCHHDEMQTPIQGWMGHQSPFDFESTYRSSGIKQFLAGTPAILSMSALEAALNIFSPKLIEQAHQRANIYSGFLIKSLRSLGLSVYHPTKRGSHVAFIHPHAYVIKQALKADGFICDYRAPNLLRICINPLYLHQRDIESLINQIQFILDKQRYLHHQHPNQEKVT